MEIASLVVGGAGTAALMSACTPEHRSPKSLLPAVVSSTSLHLDGWGKGTFRQDYSYSGNALLNSFYFLMTRGRAVTSNFDHHLKRVMLIVGENENGYSDPGKLLLGFHDDNSNDDCRYAVAHHAIQGEEGRIAETGIRFSGVGGKTVEIGQAPASVFVLRGFSLTFDSSDHHIKEIGINQFDQFLHVEYHDQNFDDAFSCEVQYSWVPYELFETLGSSEGTSMEYDLKPIENGRVVLQGFRFNFQSDHHIKEFGVLGRDGRIDVAFSDANGDDSFSWGVNWGILSRDVNVS